MDFGGEGDTVGEKGGVRKEAVAAAVTRRWCLASR